jgi:hypothetical protein
MGLLSIVIDFEWAFEALDEYYNAIKMRCPYQMRLKSSLRIALKVSAGRDFPLS